MIASRIERARSPSLVAKELGGVGGEVCVRWGEEFPRAFPQPPTGRRRGRTGKRRIDEGGGHALEEQLGGEVLRFTRVEGWAADDFRAEARGLSIEMVRIGKRMEHAPEGRRRKERHRGAALRPSALRREEVTYFENTALRVPSIDNNCFFRYPPG